MKQCRVCSNEFDPTQALNDPATEMGDFLARDMYGDSGELCPVCLANRGRLAMMYMREFD